MRLTRGLLAVSIGSGLLLLAGCSGEETSPAVAARSPIMSSGGDRADQDCQVVLRSVGREPGGDDYERDCSGGECWYVWRGSVEVAEAVSPEAGVHVLYRLGSDPQWWDVFASPRAGGTPGFRSYGFAIHEHLFGPDTENRDALTIELVAFVQQPDGSRLFDHNLHGSALENARLDLAGNYAAGDGGVCQPEVGRIWFDEGWRTTAYGARRQGGTLEVHFDLDRLPRCRGTRSGAPDWDVLAHARFLPGGQRVSGSVRQLDGGGQASEIPWATRIPEDATAVELWFENRTGDGSSCRAWDSAYGANHRFDVWPPGDDPRCRGVEQETGQHTEDDRMAHNQETCLPYELAAQVDASACELVLDGFGDGYVGHYGIPFHWLLAYLRVSPREGSVQNVGLFTRFHDAATGEAGARFSLGVPVREGLWRAGFAYQVTGFQGGVGRDVVVDELAFFVDVQRPSGEVVRLWQSRRGANYRLADAFTRAATPEPIPYGNIQWADQGSEIFDSRRDCR